MQGKLAVTAAAMQTTARGQLPFVSVPTHVQEV